MSKDVIIVSLIWKETIIMTFRQVVKCYDTLTGKYVDVPVSKEIEEYIRRSYWREDMQERRYYKRVVNIEDCHEKMEDIFQAKQELINGIVKQEEQVRIARKVNELKAKQKAVVTLVYGRELTVTEAAKVLQVSISYVSRLLKEARACLATSLEDDV